MISLLLLPTALIVRFESNSNLLNPSVRQEGFLGPNFPKTLSGRTDAKKGRGYMVLALVFSLKIPLSEAHLR